MLGLYDEYAEPFTDINNNGRYDLGEPFTDSFQPPNGRWDCGALNPNTWFVTTNSIMADLGPTRIWHYEQILQWLETRSGRDLDLAPSPMPPYPHDTPISDFSDPPPPSITESPVETVTEFNLSIILTTSVLLFGWLLVKLNVMKGSKNNIR